MYTTDYCGRVKGKDNVWYSRLILSKLGADYVSLLLSLILAVISMSKFLSCLGYLY